MNLHLKFSEYSSKFKDIKQVQTKQSYHILIRSCNHLKYMELLLNLLLYLNIVDVVVSMSYNIITSIQRWIIQWIHYTEILHNNTNMLCLT